MPFIRATYLIHPTTGLAGVWFELSTDPKGTLTGLARTAWPTLVTSGGQKDTLATYSTKVTNALRALCIKPVASSSLKVIVPTITFSSLSPLILDPEIGVVVGEGDCKIVTVR